MYVLRATYGMSDERLLAFLPSAVPVVAHLLHLQGRTAGSGRVSNNSGLHQRVPTLTLKAFCRGISLLHCVAEARASDPSPSPLISRNAMMSWRSLLAFDGRIPARCGGMGWEIVWAW